jgi:hypothetical protein
MIALHCMLHDNPTVAPEIGPFHAALPPTQQQVSNTTHLGAPRRPQARQAPQGSAYYSFYAVLFTEALTKGSAGKVMTRSTAKPRLAYRLMKYVEMLNELYIDA